MSGMIIVLVPMMLAAVAPAMPVAERAIIAAMDDSATGWNTGDIKRFMRVYSDGADTSFVTSTGLVRGKRAMMARYRAKYDFGNAARRGRLTFTTLDFRLLDPTHALYIARYTLSYAAGKEQSGPTSLIFARDANGWHIIADHSS